MHEVFHVLNVVANEKWEAHLPHPGEVHEQPHVIGIEAGKPSLTTEILHDQPHEWGILIPQKSEWKNSGELAQTTVLDVGLIVMPLHLFFLCHYSPMFGIPVATDMVSSVNVKVTPARTD